MTSKSREALEALHALFTPPPVFTDTPPPAPDLPHDLDDAILADAQLQFEVPLFRWYRGIDAKGVVHVFRFQRGLALDAWHDLLGRQQLAEVAGPFRTQTQAQARATLVVA